MLSKSIDLLEVARIMYSTRKKIFWATQKKVVVMGGAHHKWRGGSKKKKKLLFLPKQPMGAEGSLQLYGVPHPKQTLFIPPLRKTEWFK